MNEKETILQICPAPAGMNAIYTTGEKTGEGNEKSVNVAIACLALVETQNGGNTYREVRAMVASDQQDALDFAGEAENFVTVDLWQ